MNAFDILGSLMQGGMRPTAGRMQDMLGGQGPGGMFGGMPPGGMPPGGMSPRGMPQGGPGNLFDMLGKIAGPMMSGGGQRGGNGMAFDILKQIGGAVFSGQGGPNVAGSGTTAAGAGAMSVFGALAAQALEAAKQMMASGGAPGAAPTGGAAPAGGAGGFNLDEASAIIAGLRKPANAEEEQKIEDMATLTIRAMINAAKADGQIDPQEAQRLLGKMQEDGITEEERQFVLTEMQKPMETDAIVNAVPNQQAAAQIYTASLMAIQVDTDAEQRYLQELAAKLGLNQHAVAYLHQAVGVA
ncbi:MAG: tellurite resistance TerB family protein [Thiohalocapsa sp.]|uniref:tellurite resistance TerB family protein n=1 Tax=Thiohalocapsa sp. TaxID=2497641 RepID=UPI0025E70730|nr:tellurite resistance TerB family protein [Thiohalocapsa sp.]MCG6941917.1 tellurite resistance TerB family protein [Thiohalocapsa sp.]